SPCCGRASSRSVHDQFEDTPMACDVERIYASAQDDPAFVAVLTALPPDGQQTLAELIEADGRLRLRKGRPVDLDRYLLAVPQLDRDLDALDAAIDIALRGMSGSSRITPEAVDRLSIQHPSLANAIHEAASLNA